MEYLQYAYSERNVIEVEGFKPYYKWNTFNTNIAMDSSNNLYFCFKPYYKWNTFNTVTTAPLNEEVVEF